MKFTIRLSLVLILFAPGCSEIVIGEPDDVNEPSTGKCQVDQDCNDLNTCTANICIEGQCNFPPAEDICVIDGMCAKKDDIAEDNACLVCDPSKDEKGWSNRMCDDGDPKTTDSCGTEVGCIFTPMEDCPEGYTGDACDACDEGYQDNDNDGSCATTCAQADLDCGAQGACSDTEGEALCICNEGYQGTLCDICQDGFQDNDGNGSCAPSCSAANIDCSGHGSCDDASGIALCVCSEEYTGDNCSECSTDYQDEDGNGECLPNCAKAALDCGQDGECTTNTGAAQCICDEGYTGELCDVCADGYSFQEGTCQPTCDDSLCGDHATCADNGQCTCVTGYTMTNDVCVWSGVIEDSSFITGDPWVNIYGTTIEGGRAHFIPDCEWSGLKQTVNMPSFEDAEPMLVMLEMRGDSPDNCDGWGCMDIPLMASVNGKMVNIQKNYLQDDQEPSNNLDTTVQTFFCLGPQGYGGEVEFAIFSAPPSTNSECNFVSKAIWSVESFRLEPDIDNLCPAPGKILNATFDGANDQGWTLEEDADQSSATIEGGSLNLGVQSPCGKSEASQLIQMPAPSSEQGKGIALTFDFKGTEGDPLDLQIGDREFIRVLGKGLGADAEKIVVCVPPPYLGVLANLQIIADGGSGVCKDIILNQFEIDNLAFETVSGCTGEILANGGFEDADKGNISWMLDAGSHPSVTPPSIQDDVAKGGTFAAALHVDNPCNEVSVSAPITIPIPNVAIGGPALVFHYNHPSQANSKTKVKVNDIYGRTIFGSFANSTVSLSQTLANSDDWNQKEFCLDANTYGRRATVSLIMDGGSGQCDSSYPEEDAWFDNVKIVLSPDCPAF